MEDKRNGRDDCERWPWFLSIWFVPLRQSARRNRYVKATTTTTTATASLSLSRKEYLERAMMRARLASGRETTLAGLGWPGRWPGGQWGLMDPSRKRTRRRSERAGKLGAGRCAKPGQFGNSYRLRPWLLLLAFGACLVFYFYLFFPILFFPPVARRRRRSLCVYFRTFHTGQPNKKGRKRRGSSVEPGGPGRPNPTNVLILCPPLSHSAV